MPITPDDIEWKRFTRSNRGFHEQEVIDFLQAVAAEYRRLWNEVETRREAPSSESRDVEPQKHEADVLAEDVSQILKAAASVARDIRQRAVAEATKRIADAQRAEAELIAEAQAKADELWKTVMSHYREVDEVGVMLAAHRRDPQDDPSEELASAQDLPAPKRVRLNGSAHSV